MQPNLASDKSSPMMRGVILLATYNEERSIRPVLAEIEEATAILRRSGVELEVFVVDDNSPDGTALAAQETAQALGLQLTVLSGEKAGLGAALMRGFAALCERDDISFIVEMDADGQHDARQIPDLVRAHLSRGNDVTIGSRWVRGGQSPGTTKVRSLLSKAGNLLARRITGISKVADATTSFRVINPPVAAAFNADGLSVDGYGFFSAFIAIAQAHGFTVDEVPIYFRPRYSGTSKLTLSDTVEFFRNLFKVRRKVNAIRQMP